MKTDAQEHTSAFPDSSWRGQKTDIPPAQVGEAELGRRGKDLLEHAAMSAVAEKLVKSDPTAQAEAIEGFVGAVGDMWKRYRAQEPWTSEQMSQMADNMADLFGGVVGGTNAVKDLLLQRGTIRPDAPAPVPPPVATPGPK